MRRHAHSSSPFERKYGFSRAVRSGNVIHVAGTAPIPQEPGEVTPETAYEQMLLCGSIALSALAELEGRPRHIIRTRMFITDPADQDEIGRAHNEVFGEAAPAATMVVANLLDPTWKVEIEVEALID